MKKEELRFGEIPGLLYTVQADRVFLFVHGKGGNKEEASLLAEIACEKGWDVVGIDLPGWGERTAEAERFVPWSSAILRLPSLPTVLARTSPCCLWGIRTRSGRCLSLPLRIWSA